MAEADSGRIRLLGSLWLLQLGGGDDGGRLGLLLHLPGHLGAVLPALLGLEREVGVDGVLVGGLALLLFLLLGIGDLDNVLRVGVESLVVLEDVLVLRALAERRVKTGGSLGRLLAADEGASIFAGRLLVLFSVFLRLVFLSGDFGRLFILFDFTLVGRLFGFRLFRLLGLGLGGLGLRDVAVRRVDCWLRLLLLLLLGLDRLLGGLLGGGGLGLLFLLGGLLLLFILLGVVIFLRKLGSVSFLLGEQVLDL